MSTATALAPDAAERASWCDTLDAFARERIRSADIDRAGQLPPGLLGELADLGCMGISIPDTWGGSGLSLGAVCEVIATLATHDRSVATTVGLHAGLGTRGLVAFGSPALQSRYLPSLAEGRLVAAFAATEAGAGSDLTAIRTRGRIEGMRLLLDGEKVFVTNGGLAGTFTVLASTPGFGGGRSGHSLILVERGDRGVHVLGEEHKLGLRGSSTTGILLESLELDPSRIIGQPGQGMDHAGHVLAWGRTVMAAGCLGAARTALKAVAAHVELRTQFGRKLSQLEVVREQLGSLAASHFAMAAILDDTGRSADEVEQLARLSLSAKIFCSEEGWRLCDRAIQLHGGMGFIEDSGLPLLLRDARVTRIFEGANDVLLIRVGTHEATLGASAPAGAAPTGAAPRSRVEAQVDAQREGLKARFGLRLFGQHRHLHRLGQLAVLRDVTRAVLRKAEAEPENAPLAAQWLHEAEQRALPLGAEPQSLDALGAACERFRERYGP